MCIIAYNILSQQDGTQIINNCDEGVLILWLFFLRQCHFQNLPLLSQIFKSHNDVPKIFHCLASPGKVSAFALKYEDSMDKEKHSLRNFAVSQSEGSYSKKLLPTSIVTFNTKEASFENDIASEKLLKNQNAFIKIIDLGVVLLENECSTH